MSTAPKQLKYTEDHEWLSVSGNTVTIGITDFAQSSLGDIVFVELPQIGSELDSGSSFGVVESIKSVSDLYTPISGKVKDANKEVENSPELINEDPYAAWMIKIELSNPSELSTLMDADQYQAFCSANS